jgi:DNA-binding transcriptional LysR family regulator
MSDLADLKHEIDLPELFRELGVKLSGDPRKYLKGKCPFHEDATPSLSLTYNDSGWHWHCFKGCGKGSVVDFYKIRDGLDDTAASKAVLADFGDGHTPEPRRGVRRTVRTAKEKLDETLKKLPDAVVKQLSRAQERLRAGEKLELLSNYGLTVEDATEARLGIDADGGLMIPLYANSGELRHIKKRFVSGPKRYGYMATGLGAPPWLSPNLIEAPAVLITEGEMNGIAAYSALLREGLDVGVIGMPGAEARLNGEAILLRDKDVYIHADADPPGEKAKGQWFEEVAAAEAGHIATLPPLLEIDFADYLAAQGHEKLAMYLETEIAELEPTPERQANELGIRTLDLTAPVPEVSWVVQDMIQRNKVSMLVSYGGAGKSAGSAHLAACVASGRSFWGRETFNVDRVIIVDYEEDEPDAMRRWLVRSATGLGIPLSELRVDYVSALIEPAWKNKAFHEMVKPLMKMYEGQSVLLILDAFEAAMRLDSNKAEHVIAAMTSLKYLSHHGFTILVLDHLPKLGKGQSKSDLMPSGSVQKTNQSRGVILLEDVTPASYSEQSNLLKIRFVKLNNARKPDPFAIERTVKDGAVFYELRDLPDEDEGGEGRPPKVTHELYDDLLAIVSNNDDGVTLKDFAELMIEHDVSSNTLRRALAKLERQGLIYSEMSTGFPTRYKRRYAN